MSHPPNQKSSKTYEDLHKYDWQVRIPFIRTVVICLHIQKKVKNFLSLNSCHNLKWNWKSRATKQVKKPIIASCNNHSPNLNLVYPSKNKEKICMCPLGTKMVKIGETGTATGLRKWDFDKSANVAAMKLNRDLLN